MGREKKQLATQECLFAFRLPRIFGIQPGGSFRRLLFLRLFATSGARLKNSNLA